MEICNPSTESGTPVKVLRCELCRIGHRKCDGLRPACTRCSRTRRKCLYKQKTPTKSAVRNRASFRVPFPPANPRVRRGSEIEPQERPRKYPKLAIPHHPRDRSAGPQENKSTAENIEAAGDQDKFTSNTAPGSHRRHASQASTLSSSPSETSSNQDGYSAIQDGPDSGRVSKGRDYREVSAIPPSPTHESVGGGSLINSRLKEATPKRTDTSRPGFSELSQKELQRPGNVIRNHALKRPPPEAEDLVLPSRDVAEGLVKDYFTREHVNLPIVNYPGFCSRLAKLQTSGIPMTNMHIFQSLVNAVFAVGCISAHPENRHDASTYFERAYRLLRLVDSDDLTGVQAHLVCSQYLFAVGKLESAWKSVEIAIREAQSLRLNLQSASHHLEDKAHRELVRRVWHCCILLERIIALHRGISVVPTAISQTPLPIPLDENYFNLIFLREPIPQAEGPMFGQVFIASYRLYGLHQTIMSIHSALRITHGHPPRKLLEAFDTQVLLSADKMLGQWNSKLPFFLQSKSPLPKHRIAQCQRSMLRMQYLHMRLLLGRPFLALLAADSEIYLPNFVDRIDTSLSATIAKECAINCILAARELVDLITERGGDEEDRDAPYPSWWNNIRYAISCATVMLAARLCPIAYDDLPAETVETGWDRSIGILVRYRKASPLAVEGLKTLRDLSKAVMDMEDEGESLIRVRNMTWLEVLPCDLSLEVSKNVRS